MNAVNRRRFLEMTAGAVAGAALPRALRGDPSAPLPPSPTARPMRVRGRVRTRGRGLPRVAVTDGFTVVDTARDGTFELISSADRAFVSISVPSGYQIPRHSTGTARFYRPLTADPSGEARAEFALEPLEGSDEQHAVFLLADPQTQDTQETAWYHAQTVPDVQNVLASLGGQDAVGIACGDIMYDNLELYPEYERSVARMGIPFFQVVGNHDLDFEGRTDELSTQTFSRHFGPRYYSFNRGAVHYVVLDDVLWHGQGYIGYLDADQLAWLEADLARVERGSVVIVALHIPVLGTQHARAGQARPGLSTSVANREALYRLLEPFQAHVLSGHMHEAEHVFEHGVHEQVNGAVCGAWWSGPICGDGTPSGYSVYEIRDEEVSWRYKATGHPFDHQIRAYAHGSDPTAPDEIVANVWNWDPRWEVVWYEDGDRRGALARRVGRDPLSAELHTGPELPPRRTWVEPYPTAHLFYAPASREAGRVVVEAKDRFGRMYRAEVPRGPRAATHGR